MKVNKTDLLISVPESHGIYVRCLSSIGGYLNRMHIHEMYEIYFSLTDNMQFFVNKGVYSLSYGDVLFLSNTDLHLGRPVVSDALYERYMVSFSSDMLPDEHKNLLDCFLLSKTEGHKLSLTPEEQCSFLALADDIQQEEKEDQDGMFGQQIALWRLLLFLCRTRYRHSGQGYSHPNSMHLRVQQVIDYIRQNYTQTISLDELSSICNYNKSYLCRLFLKETGFRISDYLTICRLSHAIKLLQENESISNCARLSGFHSTSFFISVFKQNVGITPFQYLKQEERKRRSS